MKKIFFVLSFFSIFTLLTVKQTQAATNTFDCTWIEGSQECRVGFIDCNPGNGTDQNYCKNIKTSAECTQAINIKCVQGGPTPLPTLEPSNQTDKEGESRVWFPHLRLIATLSTIAQAMFNPHPSSLSNSSQTSNKNPSLEDVGFVTTKIDKHQGIDDNTPVVNKFNNNSSLIVGQEAPNSNILLQGADEYNQAQCYIPDTINNPGDDLIGPTVTGRVTYTNKFEYTAAGTVANCIPSGQQCIASQTCCSQLACSFSPGAARGICPAAEPIKLQARGKISPFLKVPLIEYVYDVMVNGDNSLFNRFMPSSKTADMEEIPSSVGYTVSAQSANGTGPVKSIEYGQSGQASAVLYIPHVGSLKKYWLDDLQKALRPGGTAVNTTPNNSIPGTVSRCIAPEPDSQAITDIIARAGPTVNKVPTSVLKAIYAIEGLTAYTSPEKYNCQKNSFSALGLMQITDGILDDITPPGEFVANESGNCSQVLGKLNRCNPEDSMELAARVLLFKVGEWPNGKITSQNQVRRASCGYYGSDQPDIYTKNFARGHFEESQCRNGDCNNMSYADIVCLASGYCDGRTWPKRLGDNPSTERKELCAS